MALYDNKHWLLTHIRESFIKYDDTGMCEPVMVSDNIAKQIPVGKYDCYPGVNEAEEEDEIASQSFEIHSNSQFCLLRQRSNTAQRLEKMEEEKKKAAGTMHVAWILNPMAMSDEETAELFPRKDMSKVREKLQSTKSVSLLTEMLSKCPVIPQNPFQVYAKYDGNAQVGVPVKKYGIFLTMLPEDKKNFPLRVSIISSAKVQDLVGLICWKCSVEYPDVKLLDDVNCYGLFIAEDDGEVDSDFPHLDPRETLAKFGFSCLALVEKDAQNTQEPTLLPFPLEPGGFSDFQSINNKAQSQMVDDLVKMKGYMMAVEAPLYQSFNVFILNKVRARTEVHLGISDDKIEIYPLPHQRVVSPKFWGHHREVTHQMKNVVACHLIEQSYNRAIFRLVYDGSKEDDKDKGCHFKQQDFEANSSQEATKIVDKVNCILQLHQSTKRKEYIALRERKSHKWKNFKLGNW